MNPFLDNCQSVVPLLDAYHDGELAEDVRNSVGVHLGRCESCSHSLEEVGKLVIAIKRLPAAVPHFDIADKFELLLAQNQAPEELRDLTQTVPVKNVVALKKFGWITAVAASIVMTLFASQYFSRHGGTTDLASVRPNYTAASSTAAGIQFVQDNKVSKALQAEKIANSNPVESSSKIVRNSSVETANLAINSGLVGISSAPKATATIKPVPAKSEIASAVNSPLGVDGSSAATDRVKDTTPRHSLVAFYEPETNSIPEELGISTDEDGLYAIKM